MESQITLKPALQIGFSGHRNLPNEESSRVAIRTVLTKLKAKLRDVGFSGVSSLAAGGDLLFAEACFELKIPLQVLLPLPKSLFKEDFATDANGWERVEKALERAACVEVVDSATDRPECYYECGLETIHQCDLLIVLWMGRRLTDLVALAKW